MHYFNVSFNSINNISVIGFEHLRMTTGVITWTTLHEHLN